MSVDFFKMDEKSYRKHVTNALAIPLLASVLVTGLVILFISPVQQLLKTNYFFTLVLPFSCLLIVLNEVILNLIRNKGLHYLFAGYSIFRNILEIGLTILFVVGLRMSWEGRLSSSFLSLIVAGFIVVFLLRRWNLFGRKISRSEILGIFRTGLPFIPERLAIFVLAYSDRFFIDYFKGTGDVGFYGAGAQLALIVNLVILTLNNTFYPDLYKRLSTEKIDYRGVRKVTFFFIGLAFVATLGVIVLTPIIFKYFVGAAFQPGQKYAILLSIGFFFWAIYNAFLPFLLNLKRNRIIMMISIFGMGVSIILNLILVRYLGAIGATYTSILVYLLMALMIMYAVHRKYDLVKIFFPPKV